MVSFIPGKGSEPLDVCQISETLYHIKGVKLEIHASYCLKGAISTEFVIFFCFFLNQIFYFVRPALKVPEFWEHVMWEKNTVNEKQRSSQANGNYAPRFWCFFSTSN